MLNPLCTTVEKAISLLVADFQDYPDRFWNERDIHWSLFHYLKQEKVCEEAHPTELIRAEFPTRKIFLGNRPARGHYDLVILDVKSYFSTEVQNMKAQTRWQEYLDLIQIDVAIEIKLWLNRLNPVNMANRADWDIKKLTDTTDHIQNTYLLNFVQLKFKSKYMRDYYDTLREYLRNQKKKWPSLNILCVPSEISVQPVLKDNWF